jgi:hypothetical protein
VIRVAVRRARLPQGAPGRCLAALALGLAVAPGCGIARRAPLDVPPGHRLVLGEIALAGFSEPRWALDIAREDGSFRHELPVDFSRSPFVITLPPGRYLVTRLRVNDIGRNFPDEVTFPLRASFEVADAAAVYVGRLEIERVAFARQLRLTVRDDYERAVPEFRARYPDLPPTIARALMQAT